MPKDSNTKPWTKGYHYPVKIKIANLAMVQKALAIQEPECQLISDPIEKDYSILICWSESTFWRVDFILSFITGADIAAGLKIT